jgi:hypothetical protein
LQREFFRVLNRGVRAAFAIIDFFHRQTEGQGPSAARGRCRRLPPSS